MKLCQLRMNNFKSFWSKESSISIKIIGHAFFVVYLFLAFVFYKERTIFIDCADFSFDLIQSNNFVLPHGRWSSFFTQIIPLLAIKLGGSLELVLKSYSLSIALFYYVVFLIVAYAFKNNNKLIALYLLTLCLTVRNTFYFSIAELLQGLALCVIVYGLAKQLTIKEEKRKWLKTALIVILSATLYYFHQLMLFAIVFALLAIIINKKAYANKHLLIAFVLTNIWFGAKILLLSSGGYEGQKMPDLETFIQQVPNIFSLPSFKYFFNFLKAEIWYAIILMFGSIVVLWRRKKQLLAIFFLLYFISYLVLIVITYHKGESPNMYELYYVLFGFFIGVALDVVIEKIDRRIVFYSFLTILIFSVNRMYLAHEKPSMRITFLEKLVEKGREHSERKYVLNVNDFPWNYAWVTWAVPIETVLISSLDNKETITCFVSKEPSNLKLNVVRGKILSPPWLRYEMNTTTLKKSYFSLPTNTPYRMLGKKQKVKAPKDFSYYLKRIAKDNKWMEEIEKKALKLNISRDSSLAIDARFWAEKNGY